VTYGNGLVFSLTAKPLEMLRKNGTSQGYELLFGGSDGAPLVQEGLNRPRDGGWGGVGGWGGGGGGFWLRLPVVTHDWRG